MICVEKTTAADRAMIDDTISPIIAELERASRLVRHIREIPSPKQEGENALVYDLALTVGDIIDDCIASYFLTTGSADLHPYSKILMECLETAAQAAKEEAAKNEAILNRVKGEAK